mmetsp:Transcript_351/g.778  ORF Transcript_351/g.778 Transcript_351/m.778 type:complete len:96 (-) Transcript_351:56-343(-)
MSKCIFKYDGSTMMVDSTNILLLLSSSLPCCGSNASLFLIGDCYRPHPRRSWFQHHFSCRWVRIHAGFKLYFISVGTLFNQYDRRDSTKSIPDRR